MPIFFLWTFLSLQKRNNLEDILSLFLFHFQRYFDFCLLLYETFYFFFFLGDNFYFFHWNYKKNNAFQVLDFFLFNYMMIFYYYNIYILWVFIGEKVFLYLYYHTVLLVLFINDFWRQKCLLKVFLLFLEMFPKIVLFFWETKKLPKIIFSFKRHLLSPKI